MWEEAKKTGLTGDDPKLRDALVAGLKRHVVLMGEHQARLRKDLEAEEAEQNKKITSDDIHEGFDSKVCGFPGTQRRNIEIDKPYFIVCTTETVA